MDPLALALISGAVGGGGGKFVEKAWDSGQNWLQSFFKDHQQKARELAEINSISFLTELAEKINRIEAKSEINKIKIEDAQNHPDFSAFLQKALLTSAQTESKQKHLLLAELVSERLTAEPESTFSLTSKMACDAIAFTSVNQLEILGFLATIKYIRPSQFPPIGMSPNGYQEYIDVFATSKLIPFKNLEYKLLDIRHLESLSFLKMLTTFGSEDLEKLFPVKGHYAFNLHAMHDKNIREKVLKMWNIHRFDSIGLTTTGELVGIMVSNLYTNSENNFEDWM